MVGGILVPFDESVINWVFRLPRVPIEEDCAVNWDSLGVSQTEMEHVLFARVNFEYLTNKWVVKGEKLAPEARTWREFVGSHIMGYKNMRETPPEMQRVLFCIVTHKMFSPARQIVRVIRDIRAKIIQAKRVAKVAYPSIIIRLIQEAKVPVPDDGPFEKVPPNVTIRADRTPPLVVFQD